MHLLENLGDFRGKIHWKINVWLWPCNIQKQTNVITFWRLWSFKIFPTVANSALKPLSYFTVIGPHIFLIENHKFNSVSAQYPPLTHSRIMENSLYLKGIYCQTPNEGLLQNTYRSITGRLFIISVKPHLSHIFTLCCLLFIHTTSMCLMHLSSSENFFGSLIIIDINIVRTNVKNN